MMKDPFGGWVALASVDFQNETKVLGELPASLVTYLRTEAFPMSAPPSLRGAPDYGGLKIFLYQKRYVCIAYFFDGGKTDPFRRAIPSANVLVFYRDLLRGGFRNLPALSDFLSNHSPEAGTLAEQLPVLHSIYAEASFTGSEESFDTFIRQRGVNYGLLAMAVALLLSYGRLVVCCPDRRSGTSFFSTIFALAPAELLDSTTWCSYADSAEGTREEVIVSLCQLEQPGRKNWLGRVKGLLGDVGQATEARVDIGNGVALGVNKKAQKYLLTEKIIHELRANELRLPLAFEKRFQLFIEILGRLYSGTPCRADLLLPDVASEEVAARLSPFINNP